MASNPSNNFLANLQKSDIQVIRLEGLEGDLSDLSLSVILNNQFIDKIVSLSINLKEKVFSLPLKGEFRIIIRTLSQKEDILYSVSLRAEILPLEGYQWLPLYQAVNDTILSLPEYAEEPRILLLIKSSGILPPVLEITENSEVENESENENEIIDSNDIQEEVETMPEIKFSLDSFSEEKTNSNAIRIMELEQALHNENWRFQQEIFALNQEYRSSMSHMSMELEIYQAKTKFYRNQIEELKKDLESSKKNLEEEQTSRKEIEVKLSEAVMKAEGHNQKEACLLALLEQRDLDNFEQRSENTKLQKKIEELTEQLANQHLRKQESTSTLGASIGDSMDSDFFKTKSSSGDCKEQSKKHGDPIDIALKETLQRLNIKGMFKKQQPNVYSYGSKKLYMIMKNGILLCRSGVGFQTLDDFFKSQNIKSNSNSNSPKKITHRRSSTASGDLQKIQADHEEYELRSGNSFDISKNLLKSYKPIGTSLSRNNSSKNCKK